MGHKQLDKVNVQKQKLKSVFNNLLNTTKEILSFQLTLTQKEEEIKGIKKLIKRCDKAKEIIDSVNHIEILVSLYNSFIAHKENYYVLLSSTITSKNTITRWDRTQKGFQEFMKMENEARAKSKEEYERKTKQQEMIRQAQAQGQKVEFAYKDGKLEPTIVSEKAN